MSAGGADGRRWPAQAAVGLLVAALLAPVAWAAVASLLPEEALFGDAGRRALVLDHYRALLRTRDVWTPMRNSLVVAGATTALCVAVAAPAAYALARLPVPGRRAVLFAVLAVAMFPPVALLSPLYMLLRALRLIDTFPGLVLPYASFAMPLALWLLVAFFRQLPRDLEEAALVDGATRWQAFVRVVLPLAAPGLATAAILTFVFCWNEFLFALSFTLSPERRTVPVAIALFRGQFQVPWGEVVAASLVATAPVAAVALAFQRRIVRGLTAGAVKG